MFDSLVICTGGGAVAGGRLRSADIAKGIAIVCIMVGHVRFYSAAGTEVTEPWLYQFHVPVFFIVAGYFLNAKRDLGPFIVQKARRLLVPYAACVLFIAFATFLADLAGCGNYVLYDSPAQCLLAGLYGCGSYYDVVPSGIEPIGAIWFLPALFIALGLGRLSLQFKHGWVMNVALAVIAFATAHVFWLPWSMQSAAVGAVFINFGHWLRSRDFLNSPACWPVIAACLVLFVVAGAFNWKISLASLLTATYAPVSLVVAIGSSILVLYVSRFIDFAIVPVARVLEFYGKNSLTVLCVHLTLIALGFGNVVELCGLAGNMLHLVNLLTQLVIVTVAILVWNRFRAMRRAQA